MPAMSDRAVAWKPSASWKALVVDSTPSMVRLPSGVSASTISATRWTEADVATPFFCEVVTRE